MALRIFLCFLNFAAFAVPTLASYDGGIVPNASQIVQQDMATVTHTAANSAQTSLLKEAIELLNVATATRCIISGCCDIDPVRCDTKHMPHETSSLAAATGEQEAVLFHHSSMTAGLMASPKCIAGKCCTNILQCGTRITTGLSTTTATPTAQAVFADQADVVAPKPTAKEEWIPEPPIAPCIAGQCCGTHTIGCFAVPIATAQPRPIPPLLFARKVAVTLPDSHHLPVESSALADLNVEDNYITLTVVKQLGRVAEVQSFRSNGDTQVAFTDGQSSVRIVGTIVTDIVTGKHTRTFENVLFDVIDGDLDVVPGITLGLEFLKQSGALKIGDELP